VKSLCYIFVYHAISFCIYKGVLFLAKPLNACVPLQSRAHHYEYVYSNLFVLVEESNDQRTCSYEMQVCIEFWIIQL